ncbi:hypothetical protein [Nocardia farcinica]
MSCEPLAASGRMTTVFGRPARAVPRMDPNALLRSALRSCICTRMIQLAGVAAPAAAVPGTPDNRIEKPIMPRFAMTVADAGARG